MGGLLERGRVNNIETISRAIELTLSTWVAFGGSMLLVKPTSSRTRRNGHHAADHDVT